MPYVSNAQRKYFHTNKAKLEAQGVNVGEWDKATKGRKLPNKIKNNKMKNVSTKKPADKFYIKGGKEGSKKEEAVDKKEGVKGKKKRTGKQLLGRAMKKLNYKK